MPGYGAKAGAGAFDALSRALETFVQLRSQRAATQRAGETEEIAGRLRQIEALQKDPMLNPAHKTGLMDDASGLLAARSQMGQMSPLSLRAVDLPGSSILERVRGGEIPMYGPTTEEVERPPLPAPEPIAPMNPLTGKPLGGYDALQGAQDALGLAERAKRMAGYVQGPKTRPTAAQPLFRTPAQMGEEAGMAEGAAMRGKIGTLTGSGAMDFANPYVRQELKLPSQQSSAGSKYNIDGKPVGTRSLWDPVTGTAKSVLETTGEPLPGDATLWDNESKTSEQKNYEQSLADPAFQTWMDKERASRRSVTNVNIDQREKAEDYVQERTDRSINSIDRIMPLINEKTVGSLLAMGRSFIPGHPAYLVRVELNTLKNQLGLKELTEMRQASRTGGALGNVSNYENQILQNAMAALDPGLKPEELREQLRRVRESLTRWEAEKKKHGWTPQPEPGAAGDPAGLFN